MKKPIEEEDDLEEEQEEEEYEEEEAPAIKPKKPEQKKSIPASEKYSMIEVPTQTQIAFKDNSDDKIYDTTALLCKIANDVEIIKKNLV